MLSTIFDTKRSLSKTQQNENSSLWEDSMIQEHYQDYYRSLSSQELDREFNRDIQSLAEALAKLPESQRKDFIDALSYYFEFYIESKIERDVEQSLAKILQINV